MARIESGAPAETAAGEANGAEQQLMRLIFLELRRGIKLLGGDPNVQFLTWMSDAQLVGLLREHGAKSDLLRIVGSWGDTEGSEWVLEKLRVWNAGHSAGVHLLPGDVRCRVEDGLLHCFEPLTLERRPQDPARDGSGLTYETQEHGGRGMDNMSLVIRATDGDGRSCSYHSDDPADPEQRPQDTAPQTGESLMFEPLNYGGEYADDMPQAIRVTDDEGRSAAYCPNKIDGKVVDSKFYSTIVPAQPYHLTGGESKPLAPEEQAAAAIKRALSFSR